MLALRELGGGLPLFTSFRHKGFSKTKIAAHVCNVPLRGYIAVRHHVRSNYRREGGGASTMAEPEERTEEAIKVRQVTDIHGNYNEVERGQPGEFSLQLILDDGADEYVLRPPADDVRTLMMMIDEAESMYFDIEQGVLILRELD
jgi:hypothetical protein